MNESTTRAKPLDGRAYGSIGHLPASRLGTGDHKVDKAHNRMLTEQASMKDDVVIVTEKLDGSCCSVANIDGRIVPLLRSGYLARASNFEQHHLFADWVEARGGWFNELQPGERIVGEWLIQAHGTRYQITRDHELFVAFDIIRGTGSKQARVSFGEFRARTKKMPIMTAPLVHYGTPISVEAVLEILGPHGFHNAIDPPEGAVWRVERENRVLQMAKFVRNDKADGCFLPDVTGKEPVWNFPVETVRAAQPAQLQKMPEPPNVNEMIGSQINME